MDNTNDKDSRPLFQGIDEFERTYAPEELPEDDPARMRVSLDEGIGNYIDPTEIDDSTPAPVASVGSSPSGEMTTPSFDHRDQGDAADNIEDQAPIGLDDVPDDER